MYKKMLYDAFINQDNIKFLEIFEAYLSQGYGVDYDIIYFYVNILISLREYDKACRNIRIIEKYMVEHHLEKRLIKFYTLCVKPKEVERVIKEYNLERDNEVALLKSYVLQGKIKEAKDYASVVKYRNISYEARGTVFIYESMIYNHQVKDAFIETEYNCFIENGNVLEPGHIVYLKHEPVSDYRNFGDTKMVSRPYMIWRIDGDKVYLFPVSTSVTEKRAAEAYVLYVQKYPNS